MRYPGGIQAGVLCSCKSALLPNNELPSSLALPVRSLAVPVTDCPGASGKLLLSLSPPKEGVLYADSKLLQILPSVGFFFPCQEGGQAIRRVQGHASGTPDC